MVRTMVAAILGGKPMSPGAGAGAPQVGISPASAVAARMQVKAIVINNLLIDVSPFEV